MIGYNVLSADLSIENQTGKGFEVKSSLINLYTWLSGFSGNILKSFGERGLDYGKFQTSIDSLATLEPGWDYGEGESIASNVLQSAKQIGDSIGLSGLWPEVHPTSEGGITLIYGQGDMFLDICIRNDLSLSLTIEKGKGFEYETILEEEHIPLEEIDQYYIKLRLGEFICPSSEPFILKNTVKPSEDLPVMYLKIFTEGSQFSTQSAQQVSHLWGHVPTSYNFITAP